LHPSPRPPLFPTRRSSDLTRYPSFDQCLCTKFSCPGTYRVCASQSSSTSGLLYSYGPWCTTGTLAKFPCGGGLVVSFHSSVVARSEEHTSELQSLRHLVCR